MARQKLLSLLVSAVLIAIVAVAIMRMVAAHARASLDERLPLLEVAGHTVVAQLATANRDLSFIANTIARDDALSNELRILDGQLVVLGASRNPGERLKRQVSEQSALVAQHIQTARAEAAKEAVVLAVFDDQGRAQVSDIPAIKRGSRFSALVVPQPSRLEAAELDDDFEELATPAPPVPPPTLVADAFDGVLRAAFDDKEAFVVRNESGTLLHVASAPIVAKDKVVGVVVVERALPKSKPIPHVETATLIDGRVQSGHLPEGVDPRTGGPQRLPKASTVTLPVLGAVSFKPFFVDANDIGVWAQRFDVPGLPGMSGFAYADMSSPFEDAARIQIYVGALALALFACFSVLLALTGLPVMAGLRRMADAISVAQQKGEQLRLQEREFPDALHRLVRLVNKELEKGATAKIQTARNAKIEEVIPRKKSVTLVDVDALDFGEVAPSTLDNAAPADNSGVNPFQGDAETKLLNAQAGQFNAATGQFNAPTGQFNAATGQFNVPPAAQFDAATGQFTVPTGQAKVPPGAASPGSATASLLASGAVRPAEPAPSPFASTTSPSLSATPSDPRAAQMLSSLEVLNNTLINETLANQRRIAEANAARTAAPAPAPPPRPAPPTPAADPRTAHYREVFDKFVSTRKQCGESLDDLTFNAFAARLVETREQVVKQGGAKDVRFDVYVKNGKAALRVTPL